MHVKLLASCASILFVLVACGGGDDDSNSSSSGGDGSSSSSSSSSGGSTTSSGGSTTSSSGTTTVFTSDVMQGEITFYVEADGSGACSFDKTPNDLDIGAMNTADYAGSAVCGECIQIKGPKGDVRIRVVDRCPGCSTHGIDLSPSAFEKVADKVQGRVKVTWQAVACDVTGPVKYYIQEGSSKFYTAIQLRNHRLPITKLEYKKADGTFVDIPRKDYNFFVVQKGVGDQPSGLHLRVTAADGQVLEDTISGDIAGNVKKTQDGAAQFK